MSIRIVAIGKKHESWIVDGLQTYQKRLKRPFDIEWVLLPYSSRSGLQARQDESEAILQRLDPSDYVILLDERGRQFTSTELSTTLEGVFVMGHSVVLVVGGAYGVDETIHQRADIVWSLSKLVFPHQLVRLILVEQLYRAQAIVDHHPYHHE